MTRDYEPASFDGDESTSVVSAAEVGGFFGGRFRIDQRLGAGAMGRVLAALDTTTGQHVALKVLHRDRSKDPDVLRRFGREARALSAIAHPAIVGIVASGRAPDGTPWLAMEYLAGRTLKDRIREGPMSVEEIWPIMKTLAEAMAAAHAAGVVHRDLKPENIILLKQPPPVVKILDFGLSRLSRENEKYTKTGQVLGTPRYMAPELLASGKPPDHRVDIFALGVITFEALTGQSIYTAEDLGSLFGQILEGRTRLLRSLRPDLSETLEVLIQQATARDADQRFGTVTAFVTAFGHAVGHHDVPAEPKRIEMEALFDDVTTHDDAAPLLDPFSGALTAPPTAAVVAVGTPPGFARPAVPATPAQGAPRPMMPMVAPGVAMWPGTPSGGAMRPGTPSSGAARPVIPPGAVRASTPTPGTPASRPALSDSWAQGHTPLAVHSHTIPDSPMSRARGSTPMPAPGAPRPRAPTPLPAASSAETRMPVAGQVYPPPAARPDVTAPPSPGVYPPPGSAAPTIMTAEGMMAPVAPATPSLGAAAAPGSAHLSFTPRVEPSVVRSMDQPRPSAAAHLPPAPPGVGLPPPPVAQFSAPSFSAPPQAAGGFGRVPSPAPAPPPSGGVPMWLIFGGAAFVVVVVAACGALLLRWAMMQGYLG